MRFDWVSNCHQIVWRSRFNMKFQITVISIIKWQQILFNIETRSHSLNYVRGWRVLFTSGDLHGIEVMSTRVAAANAMILKLGLNMPISAFLLWHFENCAGSITSLVSLIYFSWLFWDNKYLSKKCISQIEIFLIMILIFSL